MIAVLSQLYPDKMKASILILIVAQTIGVYSAAVSAPPTEKTTFPARNITALEEECGDLGMMPVPEGADPSLYRHCLRHPNGHNIDIKDLSAGDSASARKPSGGTLLPAGPLQHLFTKRDDAPSEIFKRSCWYGASYGCSRGSGSRTFCWSRCGSNWDYGFWCWTAANYGSGRWLDCTLDSQCNPDIPGVACGGACSC